MSEAPTTVLSIPDLTRLEARDLLSSLPPDVVVTTPESDRPEDYGDAATVEVVVVVTVSVLRALSVWLVGHRSRSDYEQTVEVTLPDGTKVRKKLRLRTAEHRETSAEVLEALKQIVAYPDELPE